MSPAAPFVPPPYPFARLGALEAAAGGHDGGVVDLSIGTPCDPPPPPVVASLASSDTERGYPAAIGSAALRQAASDWIARRFGLAIAPEALAACVGTKEFVSSAPQWLRLRSPDRDTVLFPEIAYPTYEMGAILASCRAVRVPTSPAGTLDLAAVDPGDARRALCLWVNSPGNPAGQLEDLDAAAAFGRRHRIPVLSDECYAEFTWSGVPRTILESGPEGVLAVHSLSKRSNLAGLRVGFYAGDPGLVTYLSEVRKHAGLLVPGPAQAAGAVALGDDDHVVAQRARYSERLAYLVDTLRGSGIHAVMPAGGFYLWIAAPAGIEARDGETRGWALARWLAENGGVLASPGELYGPGGDDFTRLAVVQPMERLELFAKRVAGASI